MAEFLVDYSGTVIIMRWKLFFYFYCKADFSCIYLIINMQIREILQAKIIDTSLCHD